ncbi:hypothetical protein GLOIN_2v1879812 [Rhizophagus clarus]|uniref:F-box domain-containing protein n=1 Tax=Rhizophagus clarus TaxID=94130 RepID=A0A8H3QF32_9GLOM|nr:hypothetical protein GLOIN_2v1879812 [Rhizophagus clarus]
MADKLPNELLLDIFTSLYHEISFPELVQLRRTCKRWNNLIPIVISDELLQYCEDGWLFMFKTTHENNQNKKKNKESKESKQIFADFIKYDSTCQTFDFEFNDECNALLEKKKSIEVWVTHVNNAMYSYIGINGEKSYGILGMEGTKDEFHVQYMKVKDVILFKVLEVFRKFDK